MKLVVTQPFAGHEVGAEITDPEAIASALETHASSVVKVADTPKQEAPGPAPAPAPASRQSTSRT